MQAYPPLTQYESHLLTQPTTSVAKVSRLISEDKIPEAKTLIGDKNFDQAVVRQPLIEAGLKCDPSLIKFLADHGGTDVTWGMVGLNFSRCNSSLVEGTIKDPGLLVRILITTDQRGTLGKFLLLQPVLPIIPSAIKYLPFNGTSAYFLLLQHELGIPPTLSIASGFGGITGPIRLTYQNYRRALLGPFKDPLPFKFDLDFEELGGGFDPYYSAVFLSQAIRDAPYDARVGLWIQKIFKLRQIFESNTVKLGNLKPTGSNPSEQWYSSQDNKARITAHAYLDTKWELIYRRLLWVKSPLIQEITKKYRRNPSFSPDFLDEDKLEDQVRLEIDRQLEQRATLPYEIDDPIPFEPLSGQLGWGLRRALLWKSVVGPWTEGWLQEAYTLQQMDQIPLDSVLEATEYLIQKIPQSGDFGVDPIPPGEDANKMMALISTHGLPVAELILRRGRIDLWNSFSPYVGLDVYVKSLNLDPITSPSSRINVSPSRARSKDTESLHKEVYQRIVLAARDGGIFSLAAVLTPLAGTIPEETLRPTFQAFRQEKMKTAIDRVDTIHAKLLPSIQQWKKQTANDAPGTSTSSVPSGGFPLASNDEHFELYRAILYGRYFDVGKALAKNVVYILDFDASVTGYTIKYAAAMLSTPEIAALIKAYEKDPDKVRNIAKTREGLTQFEKDGFRMDPGGS
jgi:hypothetical protein